MRIRMINKALLVVALLVTGGNVLAENPLSSRSFQCQELKQLVSEKERVYLKGFLGSRSSVYAEASSCDYLHEIALKSAWITKDVRSCVVGYRCISRYQRLFGGDD